MQLPPGMAFDYERLAHFLRCVPSGLDTAVEFRHPSWHQDSVFELLESRGVAYCVMSGANPPCIVRTTAQFVYVRLHGPDHHHLYAGSYRDDDLRWWADRIGEWHNRGAEIFMYFNNDGDANAVKNAMTLKEMLRLRALQSPTL